MKSKTNNIKMKKTLAAKNIINNSSITIYTLIISIISMIIFELCYCNSELLANYLLKTENTIKYNFSFCRILVYLTLIIMYIITKKKFIENAIETAQNKYKRIFVYIVNFFAILITIISIIICLNNPLWFRGMSIGMLAVLMSGLFIIFISNDYIKNIIVTLATFGILFSISTNFNHAIDEKKHFMSAFNVSFLNFDFDNRPISDSKVENLPQISKFNTIDIFLREPYNPEITHDVNMDDIPSTPANYSAILYIPSAIGIAVARLSGGSIIDMYILGRIFNLIAYGFLICLVLKILPFKKNVFFVLFMLPMMIVLSGTYSIDGMCMGLVSLFIAYCLKIYHTSETISLKQFCILTGLFLLMLLAKSMAYIMVALIVFILPLKKTFKKNKKYIPIMLAVSAIVLAIFVFLLLNIKNSKIQADTRWGGNVNPQEQMQFIVNNPLKDMQIAINHFKDTLVSFNWYSMLHYEVFFGKNAQNVMLILMLFVLYVSILDDEHNFKFKEKIIMISSFIIVWGTTSLPLYLSITEVGHMHIRGYQARYIFPILSLLLMCISNSKIKSNKIKNINIAITSGIFIFVSIIQSILV